MKSILYNNKIRKSIKTGDLYFTHDHSMVSDLIRIFTNSKVSHVGMFVWIGQRLFTVESTGLYGCRMIPASVRLHEPFYLVHTKTKSSKQFIDSILKDVGRVKYNYLGVLVALFYRTHYQRQFCSEWVANKLGLKFKGLSRGIEPQDLLESFTK